MKYSKVILIGMMGAGKSKVSDLLSQELKMKKIEADEVFVRKFGNIANYFNTLGEASFRKKETEILKEILKEDNFILSTGGGIVLSEENRNLIFNQDNCVIYLKASPETIYERVKFDNQRPLLKVLNPKQEIEKILNERQSYYEMANIQIDTDDMEVDEVVFEIWKKLQ